VRIRQRVASGVALYNSIERVWQGVGLASEGLKRLLLGIGGRSAADFAGSFLAFEARLAKRELYMGLLRARERTEPSNLTKHALSGVLGSLHQGV
jgi:hypothetical protein